jgi:hypothetical protein
MSTVRKAIRQSFIVPLLVCGTIFLAAHTSIITEYQIKAAFLFNFTQFVEWPANAFPEPETPLIIGILGEDPFGNYLEETVTGEKVNGHPLVIQHYKNIGEVKTCHILFINRAETNKPEQAVINLKGKFILTVSDGNNFIKQGGMISFITRDNKIQIQINPEAAKEANLIISSKLLRLAETFNPKENN